MNRVKTNSKPKNGYKANLASNATVANHIYTAAMFPLALIYFEVILHFSAKIEWTTSSLMYVLFSSLILGTVLHTISTLFNPRINRIVLLTLMFAVGFVYAIYQVYYSFFSAFIDFNAVGEAGNMFKDFFANIVLYTFKNIIWILLFLLPFAGLLFLTKKIVTVEKTPWNAKAFLISFAVILSLLRIGVVNANTSEGGSKFYYNEGFDPTVSASKFGLVTSIRLNAKYTLFGEPEVEIPGGIETESVDLGQLFGKPTTPQQTQPPVTPGTTTPGDTGTAGGSNTEQETTPPPEPFVPVDQVTVDFNTLIANESNSTIKGYHEYFASVEPTKTNVYTGMFEGKNLIYITAEGFTSKIIDPVLTPTLYKLSTQGFVFKNCYNGIWGGSTATGEYLAMTGLFHDSARCLKISGGGDDGKTRLMYYAIGSTFQRENYNTVAFHNNTFTYYSRNLSHTNMGFSQFIAANDKNYSAGITYPTSAWPKSDLEMAQLSTSYYLNSDKPFLAYYMTVSGHANYSWSGNNMSKKHRAEVQHLNYSEEVKAYIACNLELELMVKNLIEQLEAAGKLNDTVFVISADHFPYPLSDESLSELYGLPVDGIRDNFELYKNQFIIWSASMTEPVVSDKYCSSMDIVPTVYNLFGIKYDSRLLMGIDLMSDTPGLVILNTQESSWNWLTDYGVYRSGKGFTLHPGVTVENSSQLDAYIRNMRSVVSQKGNISKQILNKDYYRYVFK